MQTNFRKGYGEHFDEIYGRAIEKMKKPFSEKEQKGFERCKRILTPEKVERHLQEAYNCVLERKKDLNKV